MLDPERRESDFRVVNCALRLGRQWRVERGHAVLLKYMQMSGSFMLDAPDIDRSVSSRPINLEPPGIKRPESFEPRCGEVAVS